MILQIVIRLLRLARRLVGYDAYLVLRRRALRHRVLRRRVVRRQMLRRRMLRRLVLRHLLLRRLVLRCLVLRLTFKKISKKKNYRKVVHAYHFLHILLDLVPIFSKNLRWLLLLWPGCVYDS